MSGTLTDPSVDADRKLFLSKRGSDKIGVLISSGDTGNRACEKQKSKFALEVGELNESSDAKSSRDKHKVRKIDDIVDLI